MQHTPTDNTGDLPQQAYRVAPLEQGKLTVQPSISEGDVLYNDPNDPPADQRAILQGFHYTVKTDKMIMNSVFLNNELINRGRIKNKYLSK